MTTGRDVADAVLHEGYVLYPYRASSTKNRFRWIFGVLAPRAWSEAGGCEPSFLETQCLLESGGGAKVELTFRCLQIVRRRIERAENGGFVPVESMRVGERLLVSWDEGETREISCAHALQAPASTHDFTLEASRTVEDVTDPTEGLVARVTRESACVSGRISIRGELAGDGLWKLTVRVENTTPFTDLEASRDRVLPSSCIGSHLLLTARDGAFVSMFDPPPHAREAAFACRSVRAFPVLLGPANAREAVLASPIILYDHPQIAPESPGDFYDAAEIDELLALRTANLTPEEKVEARATDPRAAAIVDRVDAMPPEMLERLHGAVRDLERAEMVPHRPSSPFVAGARVRIRPGSRRTDAQDLLFFGRIARIEEVKRDLEDREVFAVTIEDDPASELHRWYGRFHYYYADELEAVS